MNSDLHALMLNIFTQHTGILMQNTPLVIYSGIVADDNNSCSYKGNIMTHWLFKHRWIGLYGSHSAPNFSSAALYASILGRLVGWAARPVIDPCTPSILPLEIQESAHTPPAFTGDTIYLFIYLYFVKSRILGLNPWSLFIIAPISCC